MTTNNAGLAQLDKLDRDIIAHLQQDGRKAFTDIAKELNISEGTVRNRVGRLVDGNVLQVVGMVDPYQLGFDAPALIGVSVSPPDIERAAAEIAELAEVSYLIMVSGDFDLYVEVMCRDRDHLAKFLNERLRQVPGVQRTETFLILKTYKLAYGAAPNHPPGQY
ncbi:MAG: Lrp/AsnC family transcriptional regulator [Anaerolineae bacterium]|nr:MAG: Lrp/AsnC family transcriptional regulator [Anaerolineae bacterium]